MKGIYLFDNKQNLIKSISADLLTENFQEQEFYGTMAGQMLQLSVRNKFRNHTYRLFHN